MVPLTSRGVKSPATSFTFEVLRLLMVDEYFLVIKIPLAVIAPRPAENLFNIRVAALLLAHLLTEMSCEKRVYKQ
jgi:hypothetical protein